ncbi:MAG: DNA alkylation repair protein [Bacteroidota bacterium]
MIVSQILTELRLLGSQKNVEGMKRYNITAQKAFGVSAPDIRALAKHNNKDHNLALSLWRTEYHEARILAAFIADPGKMNLRLLDHWANQIVNWAQCDCCCAELFQKTAYAFVLPFRWTKSKKEFVRRAGLVMIAELAVHHKQTDDSEFEKFFPLIYTYSTDERNFVRKGVNWALRQIGKRNLRLHKKAIALSKEIQNIPSPSAQWIARDAIRELNDPKTIAMIKRRKGVL